MELNKVYNEDCLSGMIKLPDSSIDLTVTSPPYDNLRTYNNSLEWSFEIFQDIAKELFRVTKEGGVVVWVVADSTIHGSESGTSFKQALYFKEIGFNLHDTMIYKKANFPPLTHRRYEQSFEYMFVFSKSKPKSFNPILIDCIHAGRIINRHRKDYEKGCATRFESDKISKPTADKKQKENVWEYKLGGGSTVSHVAQFPLQLATDHIISWSNENDIVLDPFMGSGTTAIACINTNRNYIGFEKEEKYYQIIQNRIKNHTPQLKLIA